MRTLFFVYLTAFSLWAGTHQVERTVVVSNSNDYPEIVLIACVRGQFTGYVAECFRQEQNASFDAKYEQNDFYLFAMPPELLEELGGVNASSLNEAYVETPPINFDAYLDNNGLEPVLKSWPYEVDDAYTVDEDHYVYEITDVNGTKVSFRLAKRKLSFNNGTPDTMVIYEEEEK